MKANPVVEAEREADEYLIEAFNLLRQHRSGEDVEHYIIGAVRSMELEGMNVETLRLFMSRSPSAYAN
jgi:hypothetical protein